MINTNYSRLLRQEANLIKKVISEDPRTTGEFQIESSKDNKQIVLTRKVRRKYEIIAEFTMLGIKIKNEKYNEIIKSAIKDINQALFLND